jgi:hypothetical protein
MPLRGEPPPAAVDQRAPLHQITDAPQRYPRGPPMTLGNMRQLGVQRLIASCLNPSCRHSALIGVSKFPVDTGVPSFASKVVCAKCGARGRQIDVRPNWKEKSTRENMTGKQWR